MDLTPYGYKAIMAMAWTVFFHEEFDVELQVLDQDLQDELLAHAKLLQEFGPQLGRPAVDSLKGSKHANMKELRVEWKRQIWRIAFAFDPEGRHPAGGRRQRWRGSETLLRKIDRNCRRPV